MRVLMILVLTYPLWALPLAMLLGKRLSDMAPRRKTSDDIYWDIHQ